MLRESQQWWLLTQHEIIEFSRYASDRIWLPTDAGTGVPEEICGIYLHSRSD